MTETLGLRVTKDLACAAYIARKKAGEDARVELELLTQAVRRSLALTNRFSEDVVTDATISLEEEVDRA